MEEKYPEGYATCEALQRVVVPLVEEEIPYGSEDPSDELRYTVMPGLEHKYADTVVLLITNECFGHCRYCFRKSSKLELEDGNPSAAIEYINEHEEITCVLISGGDPMTCPGATKYLIGQLRNDVAVRIGTKALAYKPTAIFGLHITRRPIYIVNHFVHPAEFTLAALVGIGHCHTESFNMLNQFPLLRGINDNVETLRELFRILVHQGITPYYVFQCRPAKGNKHFVVPIERAYGLFRQAIAPFSGLVRQVRFVISHATGKVEVIALSDKCIAFKYHRLAKDLHQKWADEPFVFDRNPEALWLDDYPEFQEVLKSVNYSSVTK